MSPTRVENPGVDSVIDGRFDPRFVDPESPACRLTAPRLPYRAANRTSSIVEPSVDDSTTDGFGYDTFRG
ncbi:hypothetical protein Hrd1104_04335 [Halorhabdus sp. CBA1104]|nr:hypothetical protein Hrd1104_04335 [Halorhabdus sp. CBA1104]